MLSTINNFHAVGFEHKEQSSTSRAGDRKNQRWTFSFQTFFLQLSLRKVKAKRSSRKLQVAPCQKWTWCSDDVFYCWANQTVSCKSYSWSDFFSRFLKPAHNEKQIESNTAVNYRRILTIFMSFFFAVTSCEPFQYIKNFQWNFDGFAIRYGWLCTAP